MCFVDEMPGLRLLQDPFCRNHSLGGSYDFCVLLSVGCGHGTVRVLSVQCVMFHCVSGRRNVKIWVFNVPECSMQHFCTVDLNLLLFSIREWYLLCGSLISTVVTYFISSIKLRYFYQHFAWTLLTSVVKQNTHYFTSKDFGHPI